MPIPQKVVVVAALLTNVCSSVSLITVNKYLFKELGFNYVVTLSAMHFMFNAVLQFTMMRAGAFQYKTMPFRDVLELAVSFCCSIVFMNLSLRTNTVGFYQVTKLLIIPCTVALQFGLWGQTLPAKILGTLVLTVAGVGVAVVTDVSMNFLGTVISAFAVVSTSMYQLWCGRKQKVLGVSSSMVLLHQAPAASVILMVLAPFIDDYSNGASSVRSVVWTPQLIFWLCVSCSTALLVNVSSFAVIGKTSALTFQVVGHLKTLSIFIVGIVFFGEEPQVKKLAGVACAMVGIGFYSYMKLKLQEEEARRKEAEAAVDGGEEMERLTKGVPEQKA